MPRLPGSKLGPYEVLATIGAREPEVISIARAVIEAKADFDRAIRDLKRVDPYLEALARAQDAEHEAVRLLAVHRREHGG
jgi:hypothetical protein